MKKNLLKIIKTFTAILMEGLLLGLWGLFLFVNDTAKHPLFFIFISALALVLCYTGAKTKHIAFLITFLFLLLYPQIFEPTLNLNTFNIPWNTVILFIAIILFSFYDWKHSSMCLFKKLTFRVLHVVLLVLFVLFSSLYLILDLYYDPGFILLTNFIKTILTYYLLTIVVFNFMNDKKRQCRAVSYILIINLAILIF